MSGGEVEGSVVEAKTPVVSAETKTPVVTAETKTAVVTAETKGEEATTSGGAVEKEENELVPEEEVLEGDWKITKVDVKEVKNITGEEDEETIYKQRAKLYRWAKATNEWKERGIGEAKMLKHKVTGRIRFLLRQEKTLKIVANHYIISRDGQCELVRNAGSDKIWVWTVVDFAEEESKLEQFGLKFGTLELANAFKEKFEEAAKINEKLFEKELKAADEKKASSS